MRNKSKSQVWATHYLEAVELAVTSQDTVGERSCSDLKSVSLIGWRWENQLGAESGGPVELDRHVEVQDVLRDGLGLAGNREADG